MRAAFLGTPAAAVPSLAALLDVADVPFVVTRPDSRKGRSGQPSPPPVKVAALEWGLPVVQPASGPELLSLLDGGDLDVGVVVAYGRILAPSVLAATRVGFVNVHFSLLPRWRGAAPVERAILAGDEIGGVSLMYLDEGMDTGPIISAIETPIANDETGGTLTARLSYLGAGLLDDALAPFMAGSLHPAAQMSAGATHAARLTTEEARLDPHRGAVELERQVRAFNPRPGAWFQTENTRIKVLQASLGPSASSLDPGVVAEEEGAVLLGTAIGSLALGIVQPQGKRPLPARAWMNGRRGEPARLDS